MLRYSFIILLFFSFIQGASAQKTPEEQKLDSLIQEAGGLLKMLDSLNDPVSYAQVDINIGNRLYSIHNNRINSKQNNTVTVITPSVGYFHKSGLSLSASAYFLKDGDQFGFNQLAINPAYKITVKGKWDIGASYTHYFVKDKFSQYASPVQNDWYGTVTYNKPWLQPNIAIGYSTGEYKDARHLDTTINGIPRHLYDSITNKLQSFSIIAAVQHDFSWYGLINKEDAILFTPAFMVNMGSSKTAITHKSNSNLLNLLNKRGKIPKFRNSNFQAESLGLNLDLSYLVGKFTIEPVLYLDYYLPETDEQKFTQVFNIDLAFTF